MECELPMIVNVAGWCLVGLTVLFLATSLIGLTVMMAVGIYERITGR